jgi:Domain of unknown function (DUF932)
MPQAGTRKEALRSTNFVKHRIRNLDELEDLIPRMASADTRQVHIEGVGGEPEVRFDDNETPYIHYPEEYWYTGSTGVVNTRYQVVAQVAGPAYQILQHKDYFSAVVDLLRQKGFNMAEGYAVESNGGNRWNVRVVFGDVLIEEPHHGANIKVGGEFSNSYDSFYAARGRAYYMRMSCTNQMVLANVIPECIFTRNHIAKNNIELLDIVTQQLENFVVSLVKNKLTFRKKMIAAISEEIQVKNVAQMTDIMEEIFKVPSHASEIAEIAMKEAVKAPTAKNFTIDRWEMYNAASSYASHSDLTPSVMDTILYRAENRILNTKRPIPIIA